MTKTNKPQSIRDLLLYLKESPTLSVKTPNPVELTFKDKVDGCLEFETDEG